MLYQPPFKFGDTPAVPGIHNANADASYQNGDPSLGQEGSYIPCEGVEHPQRELIKLLTSLGIAPSVAVLEQVAEAVSRGASLGVAGVAGGTANALTVAAIGNTVVPKALFEGMRVKTVPTATNTGPATAVAFALASKKVLRYDGTPAQPGDLAAGVPTDWRYSTAADSGAGAHLIEPWALVLAGLDRARTFPEIDTASNTLALTATTGQIVIDAGQQFLHRGHRLVNTSDTALASRTFATAINKTYHLKWTWANGVGTYALADVTGVGAAEDTAAYDSTYDMMLVAKVVTNGSNVPTVTALKNKAQLAATVAAELVSNTDAGDNEHKGTFLATLNWARRPDMQSFGPLRKVWNQAAASPDIDFAIWPTSLSTPWGGTAADYGLNTTRYLVAARINDDMMGSVTSIWQFSGKA